METCPSRSGTKSRTAPAAVSWSRKRGRSVTTCQLTGPITARGLQDTHSIAHHERGRDRGQPFTPSGPAQPVGGGRRYRDRRPQQVGKNLLRLGASWADLGAVADHLHGGVADPVALAH